MSQLNFPSSPTLNQIYTANGKSWKWNGTAWQSNNAGGGTYTVQPASINLSEVTSDYTINTGNNGVSAGPVTIDPGVTVTVASGQTWVVV